MSDIIKEKRKLNNMVENDFSYKTILKQSQIVDLYVTLEMKKQIKEEKLEMAYIII